MSSSENPIMGRFGQRLYRQYCLARNTVEWQTSLLVHRGVPWCQNQWGHQYQTMSLSDYHYLRNGNPEDHEARLLSRLLEPGMTVVDVGANHGLFTLEALAWVGPSGRIHSFEPTPETRRVLLRNLQSNGVQNARVFAQALGDREGVASLRVHRGNSGLNTLAAREITWNRRKLMADEIVNVPLTTLDQHAMREGLARIDFLKIDVEGFELQVLRGASGLLGNHQVRWILVEVGDQTCANAGVEPGELLEELDGHGYRVHGITAGGEIGAQILRFPAGSFSANYLALVGSN